MRAHLLSSRDYCAAERQTTPMSFLNCVAVGLHHRALKLPNKLMNSVLTQC